MEVILDCFFDDIVSTMDRSSLSVRHKRRELVDYLSTLIMGCEDQVEGCRMAVLAALRFHDVSRRSNGSVCLMGKYHDVLYVAAKVCFDHTLEDGTIVAHLLDSIFICEGTFERLFIGAIFGTRVTHLICGWKTDFADGDESLRAMAYFMSHATKARLSYVVPSLRSAARRCAGESDRRRWGMGSSRGISCNEIPDLTRLVDVPMQAYEDHQTKPNCITENLIAPQKVLLMLLRFGAEADGGRGRRKGFEGDERSAHSPLEHHVRKLSTAAAAGVRVLPPESCSCLRVLLRALPRVAVPANECDWEDPRRRKAYSRKSYGTPVHPRLFTDGVILPSRWHRPAELRHLCRCTIRAVLWQNWELPYGIRKLPLPTKMMNYLDLLDD
ncbi:hypothetical protein J437_LFUL016951 [Ladona fulva]|uniref:SOCS box domain-containing protein n=1 Tax=Ladona fulva TaxID=123851 RepID=A0A8K0PAJ4_LADFU|nr:hypothetical protein J437_LFUL016951 [Ladona fulva]